jgi:uncharacterized protein YcfL
MFKVITSIASVLAICALFLGCASQPKSTSGIGAEFITPVKANSPFLKVDNEQLAEKIALSVIKSRRNNDLLEVNIEVSSQYGSSLSLQYQFNWFDQQGFVIESGKSTWQPVTLHGQQNIMLRGVAPSMQASTYNVYIREIPNKAYTF